jgi:hypothetical protein
MCCCSATAPPTVRPTACCRWGASPVVLLGDCLDVVHVVPAKNGEKLRLCCPQLNSCTRS